MNALQYSAAGYALTKSFEGLRLIPYKDEGGLLTVGYGHRTTINRPITEAEADELLTEDIALVEQTINTAVEIALQQHEFDALVDFAFNIGCEAFKESTLLKDLNAGNKPAASLQILLWDHVDGKVSDGLLARRKAEAAMFNSVG